MQASDFPICWFREKHSLNGGLSDFFDVIGLESYESVCCSDIFSQHNFFPTVALAPLSSRILN